MFVIKTVRPQSVYMSWFSRNFQISNRLPNRYFSENCRWVPLRAPLPSGFPEPLAPPPLQFSSMPSVVGVWIFSGITLQSPLLSELSAVQNLFYSSLRSIYILYIYDLISTFFQQISLLTLQGETICFAYSLIKLQLSPLIFKTYELNRTLCSYKS